MFLKIFLLSLGILFVSCSTVPGGNVVGTTGPDTFNARYTNSNLQIGDRLKIYKMEEGPDFNMPLPSKKVYLGEGTVSKILSGNFYEVTTETAQHVPTGTFVEKY
jgi:hypothetical protein